MSSTKFKSLNFKLAVINSLRELGNFEEEFEELIEKYWNEDDFSNKPITEILNFCKELELPKSYLKYVKQISFDGGSTLYQDIIPNWDGEDNYFDVDTIEDVLHLPNLETFVEISMLSISDYSPLLKLKKLRQAYHLNCSDEFLQLLVEKGVDVKSLENPVEEEEDPFFIHYHQGEELEREKKLDAAIEAYTKAIEVNFHQLPFYRRACVYRMQEKYEASLSDFSQALDLQPSYSRAKAERGFVLYKLGRFQEALEDVNAAIEANKEFGFPEAEEYKVLIRKAMQV